MMECENCSSPHSGEYGSGRFCSSKCARGYSTKNKRREINAKVSETLSGRLIRSKSNQTNALTNPSPEMVEKRKVTARKNWEESILLREFDSLTNKRQRKFVVLSEQHNECDICGLSSIWNGKPLVLHLDHINGDNNDNSRDNLRCICPNCHSQTDTYAGRNKKVEK